MTTVVEAKQIIRQCGQQIFTVERQIAEIRSVARPSYAELRRIALLKTQRETLLYTQRWWMGREQWP